jgi:hypothetical protein
MLCGRKLPGHSATKNLADEALKQDDEALFPLGRDENRVDTIVAGILRDIPFRPS